MEHYNKRLDPELASLHTYSSKLPPQSIQIIFKDVKGSVNGKINFRYMFQCFQASHQFFLTQEIRQFIGYNNEFWHVSCYVIFQYFVGKMSKFHTLPRCSFRFTLLSYFEIQFLKLFFIKHKLMLLKGIEFRKCKKLIVIIININIIIHRD